VAGIYYRALVGPFASAEKAAKLCSGLKAAGGDWRGHPGGLARVDPGRSLQGTLRPYQLDGVQWLYLLARLRLGACLADDMGLGKTIQLLSLLLVLGSRPLSWLGYFSCNARNEA
jgi:hypothetical protein